MLPTVVVAGFGVVSAPTEPHLLSSFRLWAEKVQMPLLNWSSGALFLILFLKQG